MFQVIALTLSKAEWARGHNIVHDLWGSDVSGDHGGRHPLRKFRLDLRRRHQMTNVMSLAM